MATLKVYQRPEGFNLPVRYRRENIGDAGTAFSYCERARLQVTGFEVFDMGVYYEEQENVPVPGPRALAMAPRTFSYTYRYQVFVPNNGREIFCVGGNPGLLVNPLEQHSGTQILNMPIDLDELDRARIRGLLSVVGQKCKINQRTMRVQRSRLDGRPFRANDPNVERGDDVLNECFQVQVPLQGADRPFRVYPDGRITINRLPAAVDEFSEMRRVYNLVRQALAAVRR